MKINSTRAAHTDGKTRRLSRLRPIALAVVAALGTATIATLWASPNPGDKVGTPIQPYTGLFSDYIRGNPQIASDAAGNYVVVWVSQTNPIASGGLGVPQDGSETGVYGRRFNAAGVPQGEEFRVNTFTTGNQIVTSRRSVAMAPDGRFVVTWTSINQVSATSSNDVYAQRYDAAGVPLGGEFLVNTMTAGIQRPLGVAMDAAGNFVVAWIGPGVSGRDLFAQRFNAAGVPQGVEFPINTFTTGNQANSLSDLAMDAAGNFVVVWESVGNPGGANEDVYARRFDAAGVAQGDEFRVNTSTAGYQHTASVAMAADGRMVFAWQSYTPAGVSDGTKVRRYDSSGTAQGSEIILDDTVAQPQFGLEGRSPAVAMAADGSFAVSYQWRRGGAGPDAAADRIVLKRFGADGTPQGDRVIVSDTSTVNSQASGNAIASDADGDLVVTYVQSVPNPEDTAHVGDTLLVQRLTGSENVDLALAVSAAPNPAAPSANLTYDFTVSNQHAAVTPTGIAAIDAAIGTGTGIGFDTALPAGFNYVGAAGTDWTCVNTSGALRCDLSGILAPGENASVAITAQAPASNGTHMLFALATASQYDADESAVDTDNEAQIETEVGLDTTPAAFSFVDQTDVALSAAVTSNAITVSGINSAALISAVSGEYSINGGAFTGAAGTVSSGDTVRVRHTSSSNPATAVNTTLDIGGVSDTFTSTTLAADTTPDAFTFTDQTDVALSSEVISNAITVSGVNTATPISITGGEYSIDSGAFTGAAGSVNGGQSVRVRHTASATPSAAVDTALSIGGISDTFTSTTLAADTTPNAFTFTDQTGITASSVVTSNTITVGGINAAAAISVTGGEYAVNGGAFTSAAGTVSNGNTVAIRVSASAAASGTASATLSIGGVSDTFTVTTKANRKGGGGAFNLIDLIGLGTLFLLSALGVGRGRRRERA